MKKLKRMLVMLLAALMLSSVIAVTPSQDVEAATVNSVVKNARYYYNNTNSLIKKGKLKKYGRKTKSGNKDYGIEVWKKSGKVRKMILYRNNNVYSHVNPYATEYYYDKNGKIVFIFAYSKINGKLQEYRWYFGTNGKVYRYINPSKKTYNYSGGKHPSKCGGRDLLWGNDLYGKRTYYDWF